jgi:hypothetical protein
VSVGEDGIELLALPSGVMLRLRKIPRIHADVFPLAEPLPEEEHVGGFVLDQEQPLPVEKKTAEIADPRTPLIKCREWRGVSNRRV